MPITLLVNVSGRVQGVSFRYYARQMAKKLQLAGSAVNQPGGSLSIVAQGTDDNMATFLDWCRQGPPGADVTACQYEYREEPPKLGFDIG